MNILSWKVVLFLKKHAADGGFTRNGIAVCMDISPIGLLRVLRKYWPNSTLSPEAKALIEKARKAGK